MGWFLVITDEMIGWGLSGNELLVFALVNGYSQRGQGCYWGSLDTTAEVCGISRATAIRSLQSLVEKGFVKKSKAVINENFVTIYTATRVSKCNCEYQNDTEESIKMIPNNKIDNKYINRERDKEEVCTKFLKPSVSEVDEFCRKRGNDIDAEEFVAFYDSKGWMVGKNPMKSWQSAIITWEKKKEKEERVSPQRRGSTRPSVLAENLKVADQMFGTSLYAQAYGKKEGCDEQ